ncbi:hypothetical protein [Ornithinibacillus scapharcae]|uniref:hypothetical protein n=1 Tax=Ornithinibacillus scapharcae TaxID=1147159 RepID=UPI000225AE09|nr:hypothetical protein [Ornithinibacillus scapharcae]
MKKMMFALFTLVLVIAFNGTTVSAAEIIDSEKVNLNAATTANISPAYLNGVAYKEYTLTVNTNYSGSSYFYIDFGDGTNKKGYGSYSKKFTKSWSTNSSKIFTTSAQVTNSTYGPSPWFYGKAEITYR